MKLYTVLLISLLFTSVITVNASEKAKKSTILEIKRENTKLREGSGNFYNVIATLKKGTKVEVLEESDMWIKVKTSVGTTGFIPQNSFIDLRSKDIFKGAPEKLKMKISSVDATASIRGFVELASNCKNRLIEDKIEHIANEFSYITRRKFTEDELRLFEHEFKLKGEEQREKDELQGEALDEDNELNVGKTALYFILSDNKVYRDYRLEQYIYFVGQTISQKTPRYDINYLFIILDRNDVSSFAAPGGFIFFTRGLLQKIESESELAGVIAHEMAHIVLRHGIKALKEEDSAYRNKEAERAFSEFDSEFEELSKKNAVSKSGIKKIKKFEEEFCTYFEEAYKFFTKPRMKEDELAADRYGVLYSYRAGYSAGGLSRFLSKLKNNKDEDSVKQYLDVHPPVVERTRAIDDYIKKNRLTDRQYERHLKERFKTRVQFDIK